MNFTDERLARLKHATRMAVTRQDAPPSWGPAPAGLPLPVQPLPVQPPAWPDPTPRVRRVPARLIAPPPAAPGPAPAQDWPAPDWSAQASPAPHGHAESWSAEPLPAAPRTPDASPDPYGDHAALLAAGLRETPPAVLPPAPAPASRPPTAHSAAVQSPVVQSPVVQAPAPTAPAPQAADLQPRPLRAASFAEALALNTAPIPEGAAPTSPTATPTTPGAAAPDQRTTQVATAPTTSLAETQPTPAPAATQADTAQPHSPAATQEPAASAPVGTPAHAGPTTAQTPVADTLDAQSTGPERNVTDPRTPALPQATSEPSIHDDRTVAARSTQEQVSPAQVPARTTFREAPTNEAPMNEAPLTAAPVNEARPEPAPPGPAQTEASVPPQLSVPEVTAGAQAPAEQTRTPDTDPQDLQAQRDAQARERQELEALMRGGNNDIPVRLPRRPRPVPLRAPAPPPEPEDVKVAPPIPADVSQNILARLNRFAELEAAGETDESAIPFGQLENWQDHHPERNVAAPGDPSPAPAPTPRPEAAPAAPSTSARVRARSRGQGREPQAQRQQAADSDEEPERGPAQPHTHDAPLPEQADGSPLRDASHHSAPDAAPTGGTPPAPSVVPTPRPAPGVNPVETPTTGVRPAPADAASTPAEVQRPEAATPRSADPEPLDSPVRQAPPDHRPARPDSPAADVTRALNRATAPVPAPRQTPEHVQVPAPVQVPAAPPPASTPPAAARPDLAPLSAQPPVARTDAAPPAREDAGLPSRLPRHPTTPPVHAGDEATVPAADPVTEPVTETVTGPEETGGPTRSPGSPEQDSPPGRTAAPAPLEAWAAPSPLPPPHLPAPVEAVDDPAIPHTPVPDAAPLVAGPVDLRTALTRTDATGTPQATRTVPARTVRPPARLNEASRSVTPASPAPLTAPPVTPAPNPTAPLVQRSTDPSTDWTTPGPAPRPAADAPPRRPTGPLGVDVPVHHFPEVGDPPAPVPVATAPAHAPASRSVPAPVAAPAGPATVDRPRRSSDPMADGQDLTVPAPGPAPVGQASAATGWEAAARLLPLVPAAPGPSGPIATLDGTPPWAAPQNVDLSPTAPQSADPTAPRRAGPAIPTRPGSLAAPGAVDVNRPVDWVVPSPTMDTLGAAPEGWTGRPAWTPGPAFGVPAPVLPWATQAEPVIPVPGAPLPEAGGWRAALHRAGVPAPLLPLPVDSLLAPLLPVQVLPPAQMTPPGQTMVDRPAPTAPTLSSSPRSTVAGAFPVVTAPLLTAPTPLTAPAPSLEHPPVVPRVGLPTAGRGPLRTDPFTDVPGPAGQDVAGELPARTGAPRAAGLPEAPLAPEAALPVDGARTLLAHATRTPEVRPVTSRPAHALTPDVTSSTVRPVAPGTPLLSPAAPRRAASGAQAPGALPTSGRTRTGTDQAVLAALQHALARDGHGAPLSPGEQDALRSVLGTSVADVRVVRRPEVTPALRAARADGLTVGETVFLPQDVSLGSAAGLALAAHEITHARRARDPLFVPAALTRPERPQPVGRPAAADEEGVALATEHAAFAQGDPTPGTPLDGPRRAPGLPAPWEPLPTWDAPDPAARPSVSADAWAPAAPSPPTAAPTGPAMVPAAPPPTAAPLWHAAATDRPAAKPARAPDDQAVGRRAQPRSSVDLDQVAREVYARLRERLSQELRRLN